MCILCAGLAGEEDWTDAVGGRATEAAAAAAAWRRRRMVGVVLGAYGLDLKGDPGSGATISDRKGGTRVVRGLGALWPAAEGLAHRPLDPLAPALLDRLDRV